MAPNSAWRVSFARVSAGELRPHHFDGGDLSGRFAGAVDDADRALADAVFEPVAVELAADQIVQRHESVPMMPQGGPGAHREVALQQVTGPRADDNCLPVAGGVASMP